MTTPTKRHRRPGCTFAVITLALAMLIACAWLLYQHQLAASERYRLEREAMFIMGDLAYLRQRCIDHASTHGGQYPKSLGDLPVVHRYEFRDTPKGRIERKALGFEHFDYYGEKFTTTLLAAAPEPLLLASTKNRVVDDTYVVVYSDGTAKNMDQPTLDKAIARNQTVLTAATTRSTP